MVYLSKIVTKTGDDGTTALADGTRIHKRYPLADAMGDVDELNASLGMLISYLNIKHGDLAELIEMIQNDLFDLGADLSNPSLSKSITIDQSYIERTEDVIKTLNESLEPLESFVLPGGSPASAWCHVCRTICRRAERSIWKGIDHAFPNPSNRQCAIYLNRLSDLLFILARVINVDSKMPELLWKPKNTNEVYQAYLKGKEDGREEARTPEWIDPYEHTAEAEERFAQAVEAYEKERHDERVKRYISGDAQVPELPETISGLD